MRCLWSKVSMVEPLSAENMLWANAMVSVGSGIGSVGYTGSETRSDEHEPSTDEIWIARHGDQPTWQDESFSALPGSARAARSGYCIIMTGLTLIIVPTVLV